MLAKLIHGYKIDAHIDAAPRNRQIHKIHIPISTNPDVIVTIGGEEFYLEEGYAYEVNNIVRHKVVNNGNTDRIHFIFEYYNEK